jgi:hypothetical protein
MTISKLINNLLIVLTMVAFCAQLFIDFSSVNVATSTIILCSALTTIFYLRWSWALETHPLSTFAIFGFSFTTLMGAIWVQSASFVSVSEGLRQPIVTFSWLALFQMISIISHIIYRKNSNLSKSNKNGHFTRLFEAMGIYDLQTVSVLWVLGFFGLFFVLLSKIFPVANGLSFLVWLPFLIPFYYSQLGKSYCNIQAHLIYLVFHSSIITLLGLFFNSRGLILCGFASLGLFFLLRGMLSKKIVSSLALFRMVVVLIFAGAISVPATKLVTAMVVARIQRSEISPIKIIQNTIENFNDPAKLERYTKLYELSKGKSSYDEVYISSPILARLVTTKFHDNAIYFAGRISDKNADRMMDDSLNLLFTVIPQPILDKLKIDIDKKLLRFSMGDLLANYSVGVPLGGYKTGSVFGQGLVIFGNSFILVYFAMCFILFAAIDIFSKRTTASVIVVSGIGMINLWPNFIFGVSAESLHYLFIGVVRGVLQTAILYFIAISLAKFITKAFSLSFQSRRP